MTGMSDTFLQHDANRVRDRHILTEIHSEGAARRNGDLND